jgi:3-oxoacyl-[acyl-carrier protein] reductase
MSIQGGLTDGNPDKVLQPEDFAEWVRDILKMNRRALMLMFYFLYKSIEFKV